MKNRIERYKQIKNNPNFQKKLQELKPKKNIWGFLGVILFFFIPELLNVLYHIEINEWIANIAKTSEMGDKLIWAGEKLFTGEVSWLNLALGVGFLVWMFKGK